MRNNRDYRFLWLGFLVSQIGDWFNLIASASLVAELTESGTQLSLLFLARFLPLFVMSPFAGVISDRFDRRHVMIVSDILRALTIVGLMFIRDESMIWLFYVLTAAQFSLTALFLPARTAAMSNIVKQDELVTANALDSVTWSTTLAFGTLLGGLATAFFGITTAFVLDIGTFLLSAWFISRISVEAIAPTNEENEKQGGFAEIAAGFNYLWGAKLMLAIALVKATGSLVYGAINVLEISVAEDVYPLVFDYTFRGVAQSVGEGGTLTLTLFYLVTGIGTGIGPVVLQHWLGETEKALRWGILLSFILMTIGLIGMAFDFGLSWFVLASLFRTLGSGTLWVFSAALLQILVPDHVRGRVFAFEFAALTLTQSISIWLAGWFQDNLGVSLFQVVGIFAGISVVVTLYWAWFYFAYKKRPLVQIAG
ncbi:MAG: MFS transporter [Chloroflexota bacterium]